MADQTGKLRCTLTCWGLGLLAGSLGTVMLGVIGGIGWNGAVFLGVLMFVGLGLLLSLVLCRPLPTMAEVQARHAAYRTASPAPAPMAQAPAAAAPVAPPPVAEPQVMPAPVAAEPAHVAVAPVAPAPALANGAPAATRPEALAAPLATGPDDLKEIKGVGPKLEQLLHTLGIYHFSQIAAWGPAEVAWMDDNLEGFRGRVTRDDWVDQARLLATGAETAFSRRVEDGDVYKDH